MTAEERLIIAIFGKKAEETRDVSLRLPHGEKGTDRGHQGVQPVQVPLAVASTTSTRSRRSASG